MAGNAGTAVFEAVGRFGGLIGPARDASRALDDVEKSARRIGDSSLPSDGGQPAKGLGAIGKRAGELQTKLDDTGKSMTTKVTAPLAVLGTVAVAQFASFETSIISAGQKAGASAEQLARMKDLAIEMGAKTKFSASESAVALDELAAAGFNAEDSMAALPGVMLAAQASNSDLGLTAKTTSQIMNAFNIEAGRSAEVADVLSQAANTTSLDMQGIGEAMAHAGQLGATANQDLEDVVATIGRMVDQGVPAASAGAAIRQAMTNLQAPTNKAKGYLDDLGIAVRDSKGEMLPLPQILKNFETALDDSNPKMQEMAKETGKTGQELRDYAMDAIFGVEGAKAFSLALSDGKPVVIDTAKETEKMAQLQAGLSEVMGGPAAEAWIKARTENGKFNASGADTVQALGALNRAADGTSKKFGEAFSKTTGAQIDQLGGSLESLAIVAVTAVAPSLNSILQSLTGFLTKVGEFAQANPEVAKFAIGFLAVAAAVGPLLIVLAKVISAVRIIGSAGSTVVGVMGRMFGSGGGVGKFAGAWDTIRLKAMYAKDAIVRSATAIGSAIGRIAAATGRAVAAAARWAAQTIAAAARAAASMAASAARIVASWVLMAAQATANAARMALAWTIGILRGAAVAAAQFAMTVARVVAGWVLMGVQSMLQAARMAAAWLLAMGPIGWIIVAVVALVALIIANWDKVKEYTLIAWNAIKTALLTVWGWIKTAVTTYFNLYKTIIMTVFNAVKSFVTSVWNGIKTALLTVWGWIKTAITTYFNTYRAIITAVFNAVKAVVTAVWNGIKSAISAAVNWIRDSISKAMSAIRSGWSSAWNGMKSVVSSVWGGIKSAVASAVGFISSKIEWIMGKINAVKNAASNIAGAAGNFLGGFIPGMSTGGLVPGSGSGDKVLRLLEPGEFVLTKDTVNRVGLPAIRAIHAGKATIKPVNTEEVAGGAGGSPAPVNPMANVRALEAHRAAKARQASGVAAPPTGAVPAAPSNVTNDNSTTVINTVVNNPVAETASDSVQRRLTRTAQLGLIGGRRTGTDG